MCKFDRISENLLSNNSFVSICLNQSMLTPDNDLSLLDHAKSYISVVHEYYIVWPRKTVGSSINKGS